MSRFQPEVFERALRARFSEYRQWIDDWEAFVQACLRPLPTTGWIHSVQVAESEALTLLQELGVHATPLKWVKGGFRFEGGALGSAYSMGWLHLQEEVSMIPVVAMNLEEGMRVLDLCAAPGSKTAWIASHIGRAGQVVANDRTAIRARALKSTLDRLALSNTVLTIGDAASFPDAGVPFDRVLADVPCSCEGTVRKSRNLFERETTAAFLGQLRFHQARILRRALQLTAPGGLCVYSTCTFDPTQNEDQVIQGYAEAQHLWGVDSVELVDLHAREWPGLEPQTGVREHPLSARMLRIWPHHADTGGFFVAAFRRKQEVRE